MKVNLALAGLPRFAALPDPGRGQHGTTVHLLPPAVDGSVLAALRLAFDDAAAGRLPDAPPLEWYLHSTLDPSLADDAGNHSSALFVQGVPHEVAGSSWAAEQDRYVDRLLDLVEAYAPGTWDLLVDVTRWRRRASASTSASPAPTSCTSTTRSPSPTACRTRPASTVSTPAPPAATRPAR